MSVQTPIRLGVIGLSLNSQWAPVLLSPLLPPSGPHASKYRITAICTTNQASAEAATAKYSPLYDTGGAIKAYWGKEGYEAIAADAEVDMVLAVVQVTHHKEVILPAIRKGKNVFVEWPLGRGLKETEELAVEARKSGVKIAAVGAQGVQSPVVKRIAEALKSGAIGRVVSTTVIGNCIKELGFWGPYMLESAQMLADFGTKGASLLDIAIGHFLASFTYVLGDFVSVSATLITRFPKYQTITGAYQEPTSSETHSRTAEDQIVFSGVLKSGAVVSFHFRSGLSANNAGQKPFLWLIDGEEGTIKVEDDVPAGASFIHIRHPKLFVKGEEQTFQEPLVDYTGNLVSEWDEIAKGEKGHFSTFDDALRMHRVVDAVRTSARDGRRVDL